MEFELDTVYYLKGEKVVFKNKGSRCTASFTWEYGSSNVCEKSSTPYYDVFYFEGVETGTQHCHEAEYLEEHLKTFEGETARLIGNILTD